MEERQWMRPIDAARRLGIPTREVYRLIDRGKLPAYRFGRIVRLLTADVEAYRLDNREGGP